MSSFALPKKEIISTKGLTIGQLLKSTDLLRKSGSGDTVIKSLSWTKTKNGMLVVKAKMSSASRKNKLFDTWFTFLDISRQSQVTDKKRVHAQCSCITGDTKVLTSDGWKTVFEIAEAYEPGYYPIEYNVNGVLYEGSAPFYTGMKDVWKITLSNGLTVTSTKDHRFLKHVSLGNYKFEERWTEVRDLDIGDSLITNKFESPNIKFKRKFWESFFVGVLQGDGTVFASGRPNLKLYSHKVELLQYIQKYGLVKDISNVKDRDCVNVQLSHRALEVVERFSFINKKSVVINNLTQFMGYLSGLIATDGTVYDNGDILIRGAHDYLEEICWHLMKYGYTQFRFKRERKAGVKTNKIGNSKKDSYSTKELWSLSISNKSNILANIFLPEYHENRLQHDIDRRPRKPWVKIENITYAGKQHVYDITVPKIHRFCANGIIAHNCEDYMFMWEYANAAHNAARIFYGNGEAPDEKNPGYKPGLCKHLYRLAEELVRE